MRTAVRHALPPHLPGKFGNKISKNRFYFSRKQKHERRRSYVQLDSSESFNDYYLPCACRCCGSYLDAVVPYLPQDKPTYLMGVGTPANILEGVDRGIDFFDCVYPSRNGRHGHVYTNHGKMNMFNAKYELDTRPIEEGCGCPACRHYSRAYIRHLLKAKEMLGMRLCVLHNLYFYNHMMKEIRDALDEGRFADYKKMRLEGFAAGEQK